MQEIIFSVLVITYNQEEYIAQTLESILKQEHNYSYEIIIGEDCSKDKTKEIIEEYARKYPDTIKPIYNEHNLGLIGNYYNVLSKCNGKYIMECAGDDYWLPEKVKVQISYMENHPEIGMCYGKASVWSESKNKVLKETVGSDNNSFSDLIKENTIPANTICVRKELVNQYIKEINPIEKNWKMEDYPMWLWFSKKTRITFLPNVLTVYRNFTESVSHSIDFNKKLSFILSTFNIIEFYYNYFEIDNLQNIINNKYYSIAMIAFQFGQSKIFNENIYKWIPKTKKEKIKYYIYTNKILRVCIKFKNLLFKRK